MPLNYSRCKLTVMSLLRTSLHWLFAMILVINSVAGMAMAVGMVCHGVAAGVDTAISHPKHSGCHDSISDGDDHADATIDCCAVGRCACACFQHGTVALTSLMAVVAALPMVTLDVAAAPSAPVSPDLRPPITPIS